ncbi:MAG: hypothetical protein BBJ60_07135 [Desulfobacterales bacterium S7086C20]|nr:MAG: hypothetical protein BBJ60_07135 [Desulfobacterales bacterium S7086C20]
MNRVLWSRILYFSGETIDRPGIESHRNRHKYQTVIIFFLNCHDLARIMQKQINNHRGKNCSFLLFKEANLDGLASFFALGNCVIKGPAFDPLQCVTYITISCSWLFLMGILLGGSIFMSNIQG